MDKMIMAYLEYRLWKVAGFFCLVAAINLLPVTSRSDPPPTTEGQNEVAVKKANPYAAIALIASVGPTWRLRAQRDAQTDDTLGKIAVAYLTEIMGRDGIPEDYDVQQQIDVCIYLLQLRPVKGSVSILDKIAISKDIRDASRVEAIIAICSQQRGVDYAVQKLNDIDDKIRSAAIRALTRVQNNEEISAMISKMRNRNVDFTGTYTGAALGEAESFLDVSKSFSSMRSFEEKLTFLLDRLPYENLPPPAPPQLGQDALSVFKWNKLVALWKEDPSQAGKIMAQYETKNPDRKRWTAILLVDLSATSNK
jgi:hypothetical protein